MTRRIIPAAALLAMIGLSAPASGQIPQGTSEMLAAGARVTGARVLAPRSLEITRGDTALLTIALLDAAGQRVHGARFGILRGSNHFDVRSIKDSIPDSYLMWGVQPGRTGFAVAVQVPGDSGGFRWNYVDSAQVIVRDWPIASVVIDELPAVPYVGTSFRLAARALTTRGTAHYAPGIRWRSEQPGRVRITPEGVATFLQAGAATLVATAEGGISERRRVEVRENPVRTLTVTPRTGETRVGDVVHFDVAALDARGRPVGDLALAWAVHPLDSAGARVYDDGAFVAEVPGAFQVVVTAGTQAATALVQAEPRAAASPVQLVGRRGPTDVATSDLWVFEGRDGRDYAYTGTHAEGGGNRMYAWDVTDPANIVLTDSVVVDGRVVNDVKVSADARWAIITREGASSRRNGIVVLDLSDPAHPAILSELTDSLTAGIHNVWINGDVVYAVNDGTSAMHILDLSDPRQPKHAGRWEVRPGEQDKSLHDVWADGRYAYLSYWDDGLVILDIGAGTHGGTPRKPVFVSRISYDIGNTHTAYREGDYVFVGDEIFGCAECTNGPRGYIHVMDVSDIAQPKEVAKFEVPEAGAHNIWVENGILYIAYYQGGLRIVDVSGELRGDLYRQGRQIGWFHTAAADSALRTGQPMAWGPQLFKGNVFVSDMNSGLWVLRHARPATLSP